MAISQLESPKFKAVYGASASNGTPGEALDSGKVYVYDVGTTNVITVYSDKAKTTPISNPVILDSAGEAQIWFDGIVDIKVLDSADEQQYTLTGVESSPTAVTTGDYNLIQNGSFEIDTGGDGSPDSWTLVPATSATIAVDNTDGYQTQGSYGLKFTASTDGASGAGTATSTLFPVTEGEPINIYWDTIAEDVNIYNNTTTIKIYWYDYNGDAVVATPSTTVWTITANYPYGAWRHYVSQISVPTNAVQAALELNVIKVGGTQTTASKSVWFDNIIVNDSVRTGHIVLAGIGDTGSTSSVEVTGLPANTKNVTIALDEVSFGTAAKTFECNLGTISAAGTSSKFTSNYKSTNLELAAAGITASTSTGAWILARTAGTLASDTYCGHIFLSAVGETLDDWVCTSLISNGSQVMWSGAGNVDINTEVVYSVFITTNDTFDGGQFAVYFEV